MNTDQLIENLHKENEQQRLSKAAEVAKSVNDNIRVMVKVISLCAQGPHMLKTGNYSVLVGGVLGTYCMPNCPTCLAKRYLSNSLTEEDLKLVKGER